MKLILTIEIEVNDINKKADVYDRLITSDRLTNIIEQHCGCVHVTDITLNEKEERQTYKQIDNTMLAKDLHAQQFKEFAVSHYKQHILSAERNKNETEIAYLKTQLEKIEAGDFSVAKDLTFITAGSKIYYDEQQKTVITKILTYTIM